MKRLIRGLVDFSRDTAPSLRPFFKELAQQQTPEVLLITCSDSRVVPHLFASAEPGDLFVVRTVGNLIAPADADGLSIGDVSEASAIEYAVDVLGLRDIAVCGHSNCGAMKASLAGRQSLATKAPNLAAWLAHADAAHKRTEAVPAGLSREDALAHHNVMQQLEHVATYPSVKRLLPTGELRLHGLFFDISHAQVSLYEADKRAFVPLDEAEVVRLLKDEPA